MTITRRRNNVHWAEEKKDGEGFSNLECGMDRVPRAAFKKNEQTYYTHIILPLVTQQPKPFFSARMIRMKLRERNFPSILCNSLITFQNRKFININKTDQVQTHTASIIIQ